MMRSKPTLDAFGPTEASRCTCPAHPEFPVSEELGGGVSVPFCVSLGADDTTTSSGRVSLAVAATADVGPFRGTLAGDWAWDVTPSLSRFGALRPASVMPIV